MPIPIVKMALLGILPSPLKIAYYRWRGAKIGNNVKLGLFSVIIADRIVIGDGSRIGPLSFIQCRSLTIGNRARIASMVAIDTNHVKLGHDSVIMEQVVIGGMKTPRSRIDIGSRVKIFPYCFLNPTEPITIENEVGVGGSNYLFTHGSWQSVLDGYPVGFGPITLREGVWLPWRVFILPNVEIGAYCTIGAGAVINKSIPAGSLAVGAPAKVISADGAYRKIKSPEEKRQLVAKILAEMVEFLQFEGASVETASDANATTFTVAKKNTKAQTIAYYPAAAAQGSAPAHQVEISLTKLSPERRNELRALAVTWFDIEDRQCAIGASALFDDVRNFFSRYGVRFSIDGEVDL